MAAHPRYAGAPEPEEIRRIGGIVNPVLRNLEITHCYYRLSLAFTARTGQCANWCTFATWASRQAGRTIRGEDFVEALVRNTYTGSALSHPVRWFWRRLIRRGLLTPASRLGRLVAAIHTPFDALERASGAVGRGNLKVFEEIGLVFALYLQRPDGIAAALRPGEPPEGQDFLKSAFAQYDRQSSERDEGLRAQRIYLANLLIGLHEQTRLQSEIRESLETMPATAEDLGMRALQAIYPGARNWAAFVRRPVAASLAPVARAVSAHAREVTRRVITESLMMLALPQTTIALGHNLDRQPSNLLVNLTEPDLLQLLNRFDARETAAEDWADLTQRMRYISRLFRAFHDSTDLHQCPFTREQLESLRAGMVPDGQL